MESARGPGSLCPLQTSRTHIIHLQSTKHSRKLQSTKTTPFTKEKTMRVGQSSHTFTNMKREFPDTNGVPWSLGEDAGLPAPTVTGASHGMMLTVIHTGRKLLWEQLLFLGLQGSTKLLKPHPYSSPTTVLKLTCNAVRPRGKSIRNCCPCNYWVL